MRLPTINCVSGLKEGTFCSTLKTIGISAGACGQERQFWSGKLAGKGGFHLGVETPGRNQGQQIKSLEKEALASAVPQGGPKPVVLLPL